MSFHAIPCWQVRCDWPGCTASPADTSEYSGWGDESVAHEEATELDWLTSPAGMLHYCPQHPTAWASEPDQVAFHAALGPYLLIHDGDTDRPGDNDGHVVYVGGES